MPDGTCDVSSKGIGNMQLEITKSKDTGDYRAELPVFKGTTVPYVSNVATAKDNKLSLYFEDKEQSEDQVINVTVELEPFTGKENSVRVTKFNIYKNIDGKEESRDFVQWYIAKMPKDNVEKDKTTALCAVDTAVKEQAEEAKTAD